MSTGNPQPGPDSANETKGEEPDMAAFRAEISEIKAERVKALEKHKKFIDEKSAEGLSGADISNLWYKDPSNPPLDMIEFVQNDANPDDFTELDATIWKRMVHKKEAIAPPEFEAYKKNIEDLGGNSSRRALYLVLANKNIALSFE